VVWASDTAPQQQPPAGTPSDTLIADQSLTVGQELLSAGGAYKLVLQGDGNLVLYSTSTGGALWASGTAVQNPGQLVMQGDGNLVLYAADGTAYWASGTSLVGRPAPCKLVLQDDGTLNVYDGSGAVMWASNTAQQPQQPGGATKDILAQDQTLKVEQYLLSASSTHKLVLQGDGNLVLYSAGTGAPLWASNTAVQNPGQLVMQGDGNLVLYTAEGTAYWASNTGGAGVQAYRLVLQDTGTAVIYDGGNAQIWAAP
jgi:hypothetical protein